MQNFTLGKKGISMLLFAFILLIGSLPSYGQSSCPTVDETPSTQTFCFLATVEDIVTDGSAVFQTANNTTDTQPIPKSELLANGNYFAGSTSSDCARIEIAVTVKNAPRPSNIITNSIVSGFEFTTCTPASFNSANLADLFVAQNDNYRIEVYPSEESTSPIADGTVLNTGDSYFVGQVPKGTEDASSNTCPSFRVAVGFNPNQIDAPIAETPQIFCENATVADLVAQGTYDDTQAIRWYRSQTANSPLPDNTQLINGQTYFAAQVVNARGSILPPCETPINERAPVRVELTDPIVINTPEPGTVCETDVQATFPSEDAIRNFYLGLLESGVPRNGTFSPDAGQIAQQYQNATNKIGDYTTTYTVGEGNCESSVDLTITVVAVEDANAGTIEDFPVPCGSTDLVDLEEFLSDDATTGGTFTGTGVNTAGEFDPTVGPGTFTITYSVGDENTCTTPGTSATATFDIIVGTEAFDFGTPETGIVCEADVDATFPSFDEIRKYYLALLEPGTPRNGTFDPTPKELSAMYQNNTDKVANYTTTYTLGIGDCQSSVILTVSVVPNQDAEAGTIEDITVPCGSTDVVVLNDAILSDDATKGGIFSGEGVTNGNFDPTVGPGSYEITYSVDDSANCVTPGTSDAITFTITVQGTDLGAPIALERCITEIRGFQTNPAAAIALFNDALAERGITDLTGSFTPSLITVAGQISTYLANPTPSKTFITTYNITSDCGDSTLPITLTINNTTPANAGSIEDAIACTGQSTLNLFSLLDSNNPNGGTFTSGNGSITDGILDVTNTGTFNITYTVSESDLESCLSGSNSTDFTVTVSEGTTLPSPEPTIVCAANVDALFPSFDEIRKFYLNLLPSGTPRNGTFNPTPRQISEMYQNDADRLGDFTTTYIFGNGSCNQIELTVTVVDSQDAIAGTIEDATACTSQGTLDLFSLLSSSNISGGTFSNNNGVIANGLFDVSVSGDFNITYTITENDPTTCVNGTDSTEFTVSVNESQDANAGTIEDISVACGSTDVVFLNDSLLTDDATTGGTFSGEGVTNGNFDPSVGPGTYTITYSVDDSADCVTTGTNDDTQFDIIVGDGTDLGAPIELERCITEIEGFLTNPAAAIALYNDALAERGITDLSGTFSPSLEFVGGQILAYLANDNRAPSATFETTYSVSTDCGDDFVLISLTINDTTAPNAGSINSATACASATPFDLNTLLGNNNDEKGTFSNEDGLIVDGLFDVSEMGIFDITYTVTESNENCTAGDPDATTFTLTVSEGTTLPSPEPAIVCAANVDALFPSFDEIRKYYLNLLPTGTPRNGTFNPTPRELSEMYQNDADRLGDFTTTYTFGNGSCNQIDLTVTVVDSQDAIVGTIEDATTCTAQGTLDLFSLLTDSNISGGTFSNNNGVIANGVFDVSNEGDFKITYTVSESDSTTCLNGTDSTEFTLSVTESTVANAGADSTLTFCSNEENVNLADYLVGNTIPVGVFTGFEDGMFNPADNVGTTTITYTVDYSTDDDVCTTGSDTATFTVTVNEPQDADAGDDITASYCEDQTDIVNLRSLLSEANRNRGSFNAPYEDGIFNPSEVGTGVVTITYTLNGTEDCAIGTDEATITITVNELQDANAGSIDNTTACTAQGTLDLFSLLSGSNISGGTFSNENGVIANGVFDVSSAGEFNITYTVTESDPSTCLNGTNSTDFTVNVSEGNANAGADNSIEVCMAEVDSFRTGQVTNLFLDLLEDGIDRSGTFNPTINQIIAQYQINKIADFTTVYTVGSGSCTDSATLTVTVNESTAANAGDDVTVTLCSNEESITLADYLDGNSTPTGVFTGFENGMFNPADNVGTTTITYTVDYSTDDNVCTTGTDTATFTITVNEPQDANAGDDITASYCVDQTENVDLRSLLPEANRERGSFSAPYQEGMFNPSTSGEGDVTITYTLTDAVDCVIGTDEATITITVNGVSEAPVANAEQTFCFIDNPTVADLSAAGDNIVWYEDAGLTVVAENTDSLITGEDYYAVATAGENSCGSAAVMVNVTINDSEAPTLQFEGNEFCRQDNPTIQDLVDNVTGGSVKIYTAEAGGTAVANSTALVNGMTYYATSTNSDFGCESTERLAIVAKVEFCGIPEGFSPNGDGINDRFVIPDIAIDYPNYTIEIFNRWGQVVFEGNASTQDWDGVSNRDTTLGNDVLPVGVYFYILKYNDGVTTPVQGKLYLSR